MVRSGQGFPLVFSFSFSRVKCKDRRKHLDGTKDGTMQTMCTREKEWSRTSFPECRCEYYHQFGIFPLFRAWNVRSFLENMIPSTSKILMERTSLFKSGARCLTPPPVPPPQTNLKSPVFEDWNGLVTFSSFHCWIFYCKVLYTRTEDTAKYECQAGGFNMRLDKDPEDDHSQRFELGCLGGDPPTWDQPDWPTCASSQF